MNICPPTHTISGNLPPRDRNQQWQSRRVFFLTPQVMQNDLARGACPAENVCCVVFDEAHKALGNHAYCQVSYDFLCNASTECISCPGCCVVQQVVKELAGAGSQFRVLALSATPGNDLKVDLCQWVWLAWGSSLHGGVACMEESLAQPGYELSLS